MVIRRPDADSQRLVRAGSAAQAPATDRLHEGRSRELQLGGEIVAAAAAIAREEQDRVVAMPLTYKDDDSIVTPADRAIGRMVRDRLATFFPESRCFGEEYGGIEPATFAEGDLWVVDPIDGTTNYALGLSTYAISLGLMRGGEPALGVVRLPSHGDVYSCDFEGPAMHNGRPIEVSRTIARHQFLCLPSSMLKWFHFDFRGAIRGLGSTVYHCALVATGVAAGAVVTPFLWDIAAVLPILQRAGGDLFHLRTGAPLDLQRWSRKGFRPFPMIACAPENFAALRSAIQFTPQAAERFGRPDRDPGAPR